MVGLGVDPEPEMRGATTAPVAEHGPSVITLAAVSVTLVFMPLLALEMHAWRKGWGVLRLLGKKKVNVGEGSTAPATDSDTLSDRKTNKSLNDTGSTHTPQSLAMSGSGSRHGFSAEELELALAAVPEQSVDEQAAILADLKESSAERNQYRSLTMNSQASDGLAEPLSPGLGVMPFDEAFLEPMSPLSPERKSVTPAESRRSSADFINVDEMLGGEGLINLDDILAQQPTGDDSKIVALGEVSQASHDSGLNVVDGNSNSSGSHCSV